MFIKHKFITRFFIKCVSKSQHGFVNREIKKKEQWNGIFRIKNKFFLVSKYNVVLFQREYVIKRDLNTMPNN